MSQPWRYIRLNELMSSVKSDLHLYDDSGFVDDDRVIKIIAECNEKLGQRIYKSRECVLDIVNFKADLPTDLYKIENILASQVYNEVYMNPDFGASQHEILYEKPTDDRNIINYGKMGCKDSCDNCFWIEDKKNTYVQKMIRFEKFIPLQLSNSLYNKCTEYSPCNLRDRSYKLDLESDIFKFSFETGKAYLCYLGNLMSEDGEIEIPFHPMLNSYYEWSVKEKLLEDMFLNSDADVQQKLAYASEKKREAHGSAWIFANSREVGEWNKIQKKKQQQYYQKWYSIYN